MKGRTNQPLTIWVADEWRRHAAVLELESVGHTIYSFVEVATYGARYDNKIWTPDLILHPSAGWAEALFEQFTRKDGTPYRPYLEARVKWARANKRVRKAA